MSKYSRLRKSLNSWKQKAVFRATKIREMRKQVKRLRQQVEGQRAEYKREISQIKDENAELRISIRNVMGNIVSLYSFVMIRTLCVMLITEGIVSFRSVPRILMILEQYGLIQIARIPHFTSVIATSRII